MKWTVVWLPSALDDLADIWRRSNRRSLISSASDKIDELLKRDAENQGFIQRNKRVLHLRPLSVSFEIIPVDRLVRIVQVAEETN
ncbi:MAG TPA: hypothetical protein PLN21_01230 [Gemmatales bacterium]|nr:hypothetical protein [Gemmatales bacterium]